MIQLTNLGWALLGFTFWCIGFYTQNILAFLFFGMCFGKIIIKKQN